MQLHLLNGKNFQMDKPKLASAELNILAQVDEILDQAAQDIKVESRIEKLLEVSQIVKDQQETVDLIDRIRNTEGQIKIAFTQKELPNVIGEVQFTSDEFLVLKQGNTKYLIALNQVEIISGVDEKAIFRTTNYQVNTPLLWLKNLIDDCKLVTVQLISGRAISGQISRFNSDHLDLVSASQINLIPFNSIVYLRSSNEAN